MNESLIQAGMAHHQQGRLSEAEQAYRQVLAAQPQHPEALHFLGLIALQVGQPESAIELLSRCVAVAPDYPDAHANLGNAQSSNGQFIPATESYTRALELRPGNPEWLGNRGNAWLQLDRIDRAISDYRAALEVQANLAEVRRNLAHALLKVDRALEARAVIEPVARAMPDSLPVQLTYANVVVALSPAEAEPLYRAILSRASDPQIQVNLGSALQLQGKLDEAMAEFDQAVAADETCVEGHYNKALLLNQLGRRDQATAHFQRALALAPDHASSWRGLANLGHDFTGHELVQLREIFESASRTPEQTIHLGFALAAIEERRGQFDEAFDALAQANSAKRDRVSYSIAVDTAHMQSLINELTNDVIAARQLEATQHRPAPIFIVGMPRSGTTLAEQILSSHEQVTGGGELSLLPDAIAAELEMKGGVDYTESLLASPASALHAIRDRYLEGLAEISDRTDFATDKLPQNFLNAGLIQILFPDSPIIHCQRDARDTCVSIYKHYFTASGHHYAYDLKELGTYYVAYRKLMAHWQEVMPERFFELGYEALLDSPDRIIGGLLDACGLPFDDKCLRFFENDRPVATISANQVRQPLYQSSIGVHKHYERYLQPLVAMLDR